MRGKGDATSPRPSPLVRAEGRRPDTQLGTGCLHLACPVCGFLETGTGNSVEVSAFHPGTRCRVPATWHRIPVPDSRRGPDTEHRRPSPATGFASLHPGSIPRCPAPGSSPYCRTVLLPNCLLSGPDAETPIPVTAGGVPTRGSLPPWTALSRPAVARRPTGPGRRTQSPGAPFDTGGFFARRRCSR